MDADFNLFPRLLQCVERNDVEMLQRLCQSDASLVKLSLMDKRRDGITAVHLAALLGRVQCIQEMLAVGAEVDIRARRAAFREVNIVGLVCREFLELSVEEERHGWIVDIDLLFSFDWNLMPDQFCAVFART